MYFAPPIQLHPYTVVPSSAKKCPFSAALNVAHIPNQEQIHKGNEARKIWISRILADGNFIQRAAGSLNFKLP